MIELAFPAETARLTIDILSMNAGAAHDENQTMIQPITTRIAALPHSTPTTAASLQPPAPAIDSFAAASTTLPVPQSNLTFDGGARYRAEVVQLQRALVQLGHLSQADMNSGPGYYGPRTKAAVARLQAAYGIADNGSNYGPQTRAALTKALTGGSTTPPSVTLRRGDQSQAVLTWQQKLVNAGYLTAAQLATGPGIFGPQTEAATKAFQQAHGLSATGVADSATAKAMDNAKPPPAVTPVKPPYISQLQTNMPNSYCGPTTTAMIAKAFGRLSGLSGPGAANWLANQAGIGSAGTGSWGIQQMATAAGLKSTVSGFGTPLAFVDQQLASGRLVAANGNARISGATTYDAGHWIVVYGKNAQGNYLVHDPANSALAVLTPAQLTQYFATRDNFDGRYGGWAVGIWP